MGRKLVVAAVLGAMSSACGLRSDPLIPDDLLPPDSGSSDDGSAVDPDRVGSCNDPIVIPFMDSRITGTLPRGGSLAEDWCAEDQGPEDQYTLVTDYDTDVTVTLDASATEFNPVLRVEKGGCGGTGETIVCDRNIEDQAFHFLAEGAAQYTLTIDTKSRQHGDYAFDVQFGPPPIDECPVHPEQMEQVPGATFLWQNTFSSGQGRVDGLCGGPGRENMFTLNAYYPGNIYIRAEGTNGLSPVISLRTGCAATSELSCSRDGDTGIPGLAELEAYIEGPAIYYVVVDQTTIDGGDYSLTVDFE